MKLVFVVWSGAMGGAERLAASLAAELRSRGIECAIVFVAQVGQLRTQLSSDGTPFCSLNLKTGSRVLLHPRGLAAAVGRTGAEAAIIDSFGYLGAALRVGGYRGLIVGVEHGVLISVDGLPLARRAVRLADRVSGLYTHDAEVAVSEYMRRVAEDYPHHRRLVCVPNGVPIPTAIAPPRPCHGRIQIGFVGRLYPGKGVEVVLHALALLRSRSPRIVTPFLLVAGDGPSRQALQDLACRLELDGQVEFLGWVEDIDSFWSRCDLSVAPNHRLKESFCLAVAEASASGRASIVADAGALPELVIDNVTGAVVRPGSAEDLAAAIERYCADPALVSIHGAAARRLAEGSLSIQRCADRYLTLLAGLPTRPEPYGWRGFLTRRAARG